MVKHATTFFNRAAKQIGISHLTGEHLKSVKKSVVSDHLFECSCSIDHYVQKVWTHLSIDTPPPLWSSPFLFF